MLGCGGGLWRFELAFCPGAPSGQGRWGDCFLMLGAAFVSGHLVPGLLLSGLGVGCKAREFDGLVRLEGWGRGRVGFQLLLQVEREFGD